MKNKLFIIIVGCGRLGSYLANKLSGDGHSLVVIDVREQSFDVLSTEYSGFRIAGDATEIAVLKEAKADTADLLIAATREDNVNLMVSQVAQKIFHVPKVMARVFEPKRESVYRTLGIEIFSPTSLVGDFFLESLIVSQMVPKKESKK
ncbi:TrkA family potassium uptake protein [candidate division WOR-3 bacterium]|nr:TrkA family potassium uptake protein [candidate division WOR-3 bacterium]